MRGRKWMRRTKLQMRKRYESIFRNWWKFLRIQRTEILEGSKVSKNRYCFESIYRNSTISKTSIIRNIGSSKLLILRKLRFSEIQNFSSNTKKQFSIQNFQVECVSIDLVILHVSILRVQCHSKETKRMVSVSNSVRPDPTVKIDQFLPSNTRPSVSLMIHKTKLKRMSHTKWVNK